MTEPTNTAPPGDPLDVSQLEHVLRDEVAGEVRFDAGTLGAYSTDASNFRQVPIGVVVPRTVEDAVTAVEVCHRLDVPLLSRGGGTSLAGQCTNHAVVLDWSKYCHRLVSVDVQRRRCVVEPGMVLDDLNAQLAPHGLRFGPEPATHANCTLGGMIGNNSCGSTAQRTGKVVDNVASLEVLLHDGTRFWCGPTSEEEYRRIESRGDRRATVYRGLRRLRDRYAEQIRGRYPDIPRRVSGYNLDSLLTEHGFDVAAALVGSESTLVTVLHAELELVPVLEERTLVVLGYPSIDTAADAVPAVLEHEPVILEGVDQKLLHDEQLKQMNVPALQRLPRGTGYLMVQFGGQTQQEADDAAQRLLDDLRGSDHAPAASMFDDPDLEDRMWSLREAGLAATAHVPHKPDTFEGWEDSAVPPDRLGDYLRDLRGLYEEFGYASDTGPALYGHFGQGCVHTRIPFDLFTSDGVDVYRRFMERAADLVVSYGGSLSGEHGDGQSRGELLVRMFGADIVRAFGEMKALFDPGNRMNPGKVVHPYRLDDHLRLGGDWSPKSQERLFFTYPHDDGSFVHAASRCVGVGRCRQHSTDGGQVMCPSYQVTREEQHSTRGRARLLFEMLDGHRDGPIRDGWRSREVREALDLCLACKGCRSDCPADVDMATYKAEFLAHHYAGRPRPRADYATGWLPVAARLVAQTRTAAMVNALSHTPPLGGALTWVAGLERREVPLFAPQTLQQWFARRTSRGAGRRGPVLLWPDTFTNHFAPHIGIAAVGLLEDAGWRVTMPTGSVCCGLTWISTGQLSIATRVLRRTAAALAGHVRAGGLVVGLEPSCTTVFRNDAPELLTDDLDVQRLRRQTYTLAELLTEQTAGWRPQRLDAEGKVHAVAQVHCHQHAVLGWDADTTLLQQAGVDVQRLDSGCCGLAGNFGFTAGHGEVSRACAERVLLPALRRADPRTVVLADGFSCRTQIHELDSGGREALHLAELLIADPASFVTRAGGRGGDARPESTLADRPSPPGTGLRVAAAGAAALATVLPGWLLRRRRRR
jgi:FAD/FMN-containing dehydrogenase/Fe-S oxidoreductase